MIILLSAAVNGFGASLLWVGSGSYVAQCSTNENRSRFYSTFWFLYMWSQIVGNLLGAFVLGAFSSVVFFVLMSIISFLGASTFLLLTRPLKSSELLQNVTDEDYGSEEQGEICDYREGIRSTMRLFLSGRMMRLNLFIIFSGSVVATYCGFLVPSISNVVEKRDPHCETDETLKRSLLCMVPLGIAECIGCLVIGKIVDTFGKRRAIMMVLGVNLATVTLTVIVQSFDKCYWCWFFVCFGWGILDSTDNTLIMIILAAEFDSNT